MTWLFQAFLSWLSTFFRSRNDLGLELVALRHQLAVLKRKNPRPKLSRWDRLFWMTLRRRWSRWALVLVLVNPEKVVSWHRAGLLALAFSPSVDTKYRDLWETRLPEDMLYQVALYALGREGGSREAVIVYPVVATQVRNRRLTCTILDPEIGRLGLFFALWISRISNCFCAAKMTAACPRGKRWHIN